MNNVMTIAQTVWLEMVRKKDVYIILTLQAFFTFLLTTVDAFGSEVPSSYILDIGLMLAFVLSIAMSILLGARQLPTEIRSGTIFSILTKPISRLQFLLGKFLGLWTGMIAATALFYIIVSMITASRNFPFEPAVLTQVFILHASMLAVVIAVSLFFSVVTSQGAAGTGAGIFTILCYLFVPRIPNMMAYEEGPRAKLLALTYFTAPHLELFDARARVLHDWGTLGAGVFSMTIAYGIFLSWVFMGMAWLVFQRKYFTRGAQL